MAFGNQEQLLHPKIIMKGRHDMKIAEGIRSFVDEHPKYTIYENYSGRGMFGKTCLGVVVYKGDSFMNFLMDLTRYFDEHGIEDAELELEGVSYDALGLDTIVYFPRIGG